jgi:single-strand DNA-binding protein
VNLYIATGNLARDPEMRYTANGKAVTEFTVAVNEGSGEHRTTEFIRCIAWDRLAESVAEYARKGKKVLIVGRYETNKWETKEGQKRETIRIVCRQVEFLSPREANEPSPPQESDLSDVAF